MRILITVFLLLVAISCGAQESPDIRTAVFAGGCFWCMEPPYDQLDGVLETTSGYSGGNVKNPSYDQVSAGGTGHAEVVQVTYDANKIGYADLLRVFWRNVDPLDAGGQFCDRGDQYRSAIFYANEEEKKLAEASKRQVEAQLGAPVVTEITRAAAFYPAERYHQNYYQRNPVRYKYYRFRCGRDQRLRALWDKAATD
ncbi:peptide-methionine (S)-S-oxide reductase MsrA [Microbulbifer thermotolerans]|uniref:Peptide methionine sulfoxide reductase MsrA n=1 Tax=Microbulbifer thermotolerans TaxID=252514 RepID=A0A143HJJ8_MICTH|nr:peptide-methionine (S)-S-oxide reductase MsrA [Microbulbifer thermotolerans]AMX01895.1 peptide-methionine (S)-S-oxide reductase [Microbulbifer thermotolerans]MCX2779204.1 peptide-methionine (S)-S-oxide reductase MsrA [Microbulbifer thermotolerans]MCX2781694.1 peptide-methionine (S)-S-oxide reductase MsrA [Microbulbifer thermotolerans]MCX2793566.1 peptide-methionine (S)-S-oxide reductase MsrA [Microbulbifer thermotolerans]MCX2801564.1 peptide-methionine (S)-S-oxide reductase MsrA [Microbulbi